MYIALSKQLISASCLCYTVHCKRTCRPLLGLISASSLFKLSYSNSSVDARSLNTLQRLGSMAGYQKNGSQPQQDLTGNTPYYPPTHTQPTHISTHVPWTYLCLPHKRPKPPETLQMRSQAAYQYNPLHWVALIFHRITRSETEPKLVEWEFFIVSCHYASFSASMDNNVIWFTLQLWPFDKLIFSSFNFRHVWHFSWYGQSTESIQFIVVTII